MIAIRQHSGVFTLEPEQILKGTMEEVWDFFSRPENLNAMTPKDLQFKITTSNLPPHTYQGQIITYSIGIFPMIKNNWVTEITLVKDKSYFVDEQRFGPYAMWHHEHHFEKLSANEIKMIDRVTYKLPLGLLGRVFASLLIKMKLKKIFDFRRAFCAQRFG